MRSEENPKIIYLSQKHYTHVRKVYVYINGYRPWGPFTVQNAPDSVTYCTKKWSKCCVPNLLWVSANFGRIGKLSNVYGD